MATVITVHGTFARDFEFEDRLVNGKPYWWEIGSEFERHVRRFVMTTEGEDISFMSFQWSGENSEKARRKAGRDLLVELQKLEARNESYCVIGHSHGGSVVSTALLESVTNDIDLDGLQRWMSVGTPFVKLRKERFLFTRLPLLLKAMFVASAMLLFMFAFNAFSEVFSGRKPVNDLYGLRLVISAALASVPFVLFFIIAKVMDSRKLWFYRRQTVELARERFEKKWLSLYHEDDEAVHGLKSLSSVNVNIFARSFAVSALSLVAAFVLPFLYLYLVLSPTIMTGIGEYLKANVYGIEQFKSFEEEYKKDRSAVRELRQEVRKLDKKMDGVSLDAAATEDLRAKGKDLREDLRAARKKMRAHPEFVQNQRAARFKRRFLEIKGQPCRGDRLCYGGRDVTLNSGLLLHLVTDEFSSLLVDEDVRASAFGRIFRYGIPIVLVPIVFGLAAVILVFIFQFVAGFLSNGASRLLDQLTWSQIRRSALGNDTETEVALSSMRRPPWINSRPRQFLPAGVSDPITERSDMAMTASLKKVRSAISDLAFAEGAETKTDAITDYLNWDELIHTAYFEVDEFRDLVAVAISELHGFAATPELQAEPHKEVVAGWLRTVEQEQVPNGD